MSIAPPILAVIYGKPKRGKTADAIAAFPTALCVGVPSNLNFIAQDVLGFAPAIHPEPPQTLPELILLLDQIEAQNLQDSYGALIIDDATHICKQSMLEWEDNAPKGRSGKKDRFYPYQQLNRHLLQLAGKARHIGLHVVMTFHERGAGTNAMDQFSPGGPDVPSRNQVETIPSWCDINVRAVLNPDSPDPWLRAAYYVDVEDPQWVTGDRTGVCWDTTPRNLREILRASRGGYQPPRLQGLEWQDEVADEVACRMLAGEAPQAIAQDISKRDLGHELHVRWACQDGIARAMLRKRRERGLFDFSTSATVNGRAAATAAPPPPPTA